MITSTGKPTKPTAHLDVSNVTVSHSNTCLRRNFISDRYCGHIGVVLTRLHTLRQKNKTRYNIQRKCFSMGSRQWTTMIPEKVATKRAWRDIPKYNIKRSGQLMAALWGRGRLRRHMRRACVYFCWLLNCAYRGQKSKRPCRQLWRPVKPLTSRWSQDWERHLSPNQ